MYSSHQVNFHAVAKANHESPQQAKLQKAALEFEQFWLETILKQASHNQLDDKEDSGGTAGFYRDLLPGILARQIAESKAGGNAFWGGIKLKNIGNDY